MRGAKQKLRAAHCALSAFVFFGPLICPATTLIDNPWVIVSPAVINGAVIVEAHAVADESLLTALSAHPEGRVLYR